MKLIIFFTQLHYVQTRMSSNNGQLTECRLLVNSEGSDRSVMINFNWPELNVNVVFVINEIIFGKSCEVCVSLPSSGLISERKLANMKRIITLELTVLKAIMEDHLDDIPSLTFQHIQSYHLEMFGKEVTMTLPEEALEKYDFGGCYLTEGDTFDMMSTDFALTIKTHPQAVLVPDHVTDVQNAVKMASAYNIPLAARGSKVSHSAGGQAQCDGGLLLDMSSLAFVRLAEDEKMVTIGAGTMWDEVIRQTLSLGLMPPVINDYQYLSVGGTISMGGVGFMSHSYGCQAAHVTEMQVVTGKGDIMTCNSDEHVDLFDCARSGLGQCGIITSVTLPLVPAPTKITIFKLFYHSKDTQVFANDVKRFVDSGEIDMIHAFLKPCSQKTIENIVGSDAFQASSGNFQVAIKEGEAADDLVFFLELGCYMFGPSNDSTISGVQTMLSMSSSGIGGQVFHDLQDFQSYITTDPPVVKTNAEHGSVPHPSFATTVSEEHVARVLEHHISSDNRGDDSVNEILIMPVKSNSQLKKGHNTPMFPLPSEDGLSFFLLFLGSVVTKSESCSADKIMTSIRGHHRSLYSLTKSLGGKRYSYCTITSEVIGEEEWKQHYGERVWKDLRVAKRKYDPHHVLCPGIKMWA